MMGWNLSHFTSPAPRIGGNVDSARWTRTYHTVEYDPFIKSRLASTQLTLGANEVQVLSRPPPNLEFSKPWYSTECLDNLYFRILKYTC